MANLFTNLSGAISAQVTLTSDMISEEYRLTYTCSSIGTGKGFLLVKGGNTYMFPLQFVGQQEVKFKASLSGVATCILKGNATVSGLTLAPYSNVSEGDRTALDLVKTNGSSWDKINDMINDNNRLRADMVEGILNLTKNSFSNESGTITQKNGIMTFMNGTSYATSTMAVQIAGGAIGVSNNKDGNGGWVWTTAINGAGIDAKTIIADTFSALEITGLKITSGTISGGTISGGSMSNCTLLSGDTLTGNYLTIDNGILRGYRAGYEIFNLTTGGDSGRLILEYPGGNTSLDISTNMDINGELIAAIHSKGSKTLEIAANSSKVRLEKDGTVRIVSSGATIVQSGGDITLTPNQGNGSVRLNGTLTVDHLTVLENNS